MEPISAEHLIAARIRESAALWNQLLESREYVQTVTAVAAAMANALRSGGKVLFFGNGGSAADAQHLAAEMTGRFLRERASLAGLALTTNTSALTAIGNDYSYTEVFSRQIEGLGNAGDLAIGISTSGASPNILRGLEAARAKKLVTVGLTGSKGDRMRALADHCICIPSDQTPRIQEGHLLTGHILCELMELKLFGQDWSRP
ncbi:MAG: D-sedoheptulose 7-phosphate isomerase [Terriglobales bacterium]